MAARPVWRGHLRLALVSCPVALYAVLHGRGGINFNLINPKTGNRVRMITQDAETEQEVSRGDLVKGFEYEKGHYVLLDDADFEAARVDSSATMTVEKFVGTDSIDPIYYDTSYYVAPDGEAGDDVYAVLRDAIVQTKRVALTRVVIARRERVVALMPMERGLVAHTLHEARDLNSSAALFDHAAAAKTDPEMVALAKQLIERQSGRYNPSDTEDRYEARLRDVIDAKLKGKGVEPEKTESPSGNVVDLMAALRRSLQQGAESAKPASPAKSARKTSSRTAEKPPAKPPAKTARKRA